MDRGRLQWCARPDGQKHGRWAEWHPDGKLKTEGSYVDGKMEGRWVSFFETGMKQLEGEYRGGLKQGLWTLYYEEGPKNREEDHIAGSQEMKWIAWRSDGMKWADSGWPASPSPAGRRAARWRGSSPAASARTAPDPAEISCA